MRLGAYQCKIAAGPGPQSVRKPSVKERRHRYELNSTYIPVLEKAGLRMSGRNPKTGL